MSSSSVIRLPPIPTIKEIIRLYKLRAKKQLSQNFILDQNLSNKIVRTAGIIKDGYVCEVGPGPGGLTRSIIESGVSQLTVIEKDLRFFPGLEILNEASGGKMKLIHGDVLRYDMSNMFPSELKKDWSDVPPNIHIIGNLPFSVSTQLIINWLNNIANRNGAWLNGRVKLTLTFQKEVAERMVSKVMQPDRCRLSVMCQNWCEVNHCFTIPGKAFVPEPDVDVGVVQFTPRIEPKIDLPFKLVEKFLRHIFHYRKKMCIRGIETLFPPDRSDLSKRIIEEADIHPDSRPYSFNMEDFDRLCRTYKRICDKETGIFEYDYRQSDNAKLWRDSHS